MKKATQENYSYAIRHFVGCPYCKTDAEIIEDETHGYCDSCGKNFIVDVADFAQAGVQNE